jgi:hypothetical protein
MGRAAIANAKLAYANTKRYFHGERFSALKAKGAQVQRQLWASTGTKNPKYSEVLYVDNLIGPETVNTVPPATYTAIREKGKVALTLEEGLDECRALVGELAEIGIDLKAVTEKLQKDGLSSFVTSFDTLAESIESKRAAFLSGINERLTATLGKYSEAVAGAIKEADKGDVMRRIWRKDAALWKSDEAHQKIIKNALGWLTVPDMMIGVEDDLVQFADRIRNVREFKHAMVCGMGGSSLCPEVLRQTFGRQEGYPELLVLDSTDPGRLLRHRRPDRHHQVPLHHLVEIRHDDRAARLLQILVRSGEPSQRESRRVLRRRDRPRHAHGADGDRGQVQTHLPQPGRHRRALLGALLLRHGAGRADGSGRAETARTRRTRRPRVRVGRARGG